VGDLDDPRVARTCAVVLEAAHRLLVAEGVDGVTFARISRETGVSRTTLYRHWSNPSQLVRDAWSNAVPELVQHESGDLHADLVGLFTGLRDSVESAVMRRSLPSLIEAAHADPTVAALHAGFVTERRRPIVARIQQAVADGDLAPSTDVELLTDLLSGAIFYRRLLRHASTSDAEVHRLVDAVLATAANLMQRPPPATVPR
jgi:AcrR family transcriptional regulator